VTAGQSYTGSTYAGETYTAGQNYTGSTYAGQSYTAGQNYTGSTYAGSSYAAGQNYTGETYAGTSYTAGSSYSGNTYTAGQNYTGSTYAGSTYTAGETYAGNTYAGQSYTAGATYSGSTYAGNTYTAGESYTGQTYAGKTYAFGTYTPQAYRPQIRPNPQPPAPVYYKCEPYLTAYIGCGKGEDEREVTKLQTFLRDYEGETIVVNGKYDEATIAAVHRFQKKYATDILKDSWGLNCTTGCVYITTLTKINDIVCQTQTDFRKIPLPNPRPKFFCPGEGYSNTTKKTKAGQNCVEVTKVIVVESQVQKAGTTTAKTSGTTSTSGKSYTASVVDSTKNFWSNIVKK
jgi:hypothetical protein